MKAKHLRSDANFVERLIIALVVQIVTALARQPRCLAGRLTVHTLPRPLYTTRAIY